MHLQARSCTANRVILARFVGVGASLLPTLTACTSCMPRVRMLHCNKMNGPIPDGTEPFILAEGQGFEPWVRGYLTMVFKTISLGHSDSPPGWIGAIRSGCQTRQLIAGQMVLDSEVPGSPLCWAGAR